MSKPDTCRPRPRANKTKPGFMDRRRRFLNRLGSSWLWGVSLAVLMLMIVLVIGLCWRSRQIMLEKPLLELLFSSSWKPMRGEFGFWPFITGTFWVTGLAVLLAVPLSLLTAVFISEYAPARLRAMVLPAIDILAGIPSVVYGVWGVLVIVPLVRDRLAPMFGRTSSGYSVLSAGLVLAVMIVPIIVHVSVSVMRSVPTAMREVSLALGATRWQTVKHVVARKAFPGLAAAVVLGLSRAFGETMAVMMVAGNVAANPRSVFDPAYPLPALIANHYGEMHSVPLVDSALLFSALLLLVIVVVFHLLSRAMLLRIKRENA